MRQSLCYAADFETTTDVNDCRVWAWAVCNIEDNTKFEYGINIESFIDWCAESNENLTLYFHNLRFDSEFILSYMVKDLGFTHLLDDEKPKDFTYTSIIAGDGNVYKYEFYFKVKGHHTKKLTLLDSMKIFPNFSVARVAQSFGLPIAKGRIDYEAYRPVGHELTPEEKEYISNDVQIVAMALKQMFDAGMSKMTMASNAMANFKSHFKFFRKNFPILDSVTDAEIRAAYRGGFTYASPKYVDKTAGEGYTLDVNSLYPFMLRSKPMPHGKPVRFEGKYEDDPLYPLYVQKLTCKFKIKPDKIPTVQIKNSLSFIPNEYLESSNDELITLTMTNVDLKLFLDHYDVEDLTYHFGFKFRAYRGFFDEYIDYWTEQKIAAGKEGNKGKRQIAKLMLNSLYGKFGLSVKSSRKIPVVDEHGCVSYHNIKDADRTPIYIPIAVWTTSYGRELTIRTSQFVREWTEQHLGYDGAAYNDTDSIKVVISPEGFKELKPHLDIDDYRLGAWACENHYKAIKILRQKCYIMKDDDDDVIVTVAGLPKYLSPIINFDNFTRGFTTKGMEMSDLIKLAKENGASVEELEELHFKTTYTHCEGGIVLTRTDFTII